MLISITDSTLPNIDAGRDLQFADELCERAEYGFLVLDPLNDATRSTQYALDTALGRN